MTEPLAVTIPDAATLSGVSPRTIRRAIHSGRLVASYPTSRPIILVEELRRWLEAAPTEPPNPSPAARRMRNH
jgi:hypothetical protein